MTFDDGILKVYKTRNVAEKGDMPILEPVLASEHFFCFDVLGYNRYYTALQAHQNVSAVVNIPECHDISSLDLAELEGDTRYRIRLVQPMKDENGLNFTKLTLERVVGQNDQEAV